jgi:hypothetical protein
MEAMHLSEEKLVNDGNKLQQYKFATTYYDKEMKIAGVKWHGSFTQGEYIDLFNQLFEDVKESKVIGFYSDIREQGIVSVGARKHFEKEFSPKGKEIGIDKTGVVTDASPFKKYYLNTLIKVTNRPVKLCSKPEDALEFIVS